ncbi:hypothetical protein [Flammeovirga sp. EKP202]|uniref:hypothetical protein n=1 Tax=Flammeovirga sp. EKP202 TaxID=2770592 RepID=UPI0016600668|nr:hypothetical protein [Flammeovirga sp. EKP202]MBD0403903.1 hypothetical protein [Flammeovirga sp. EKP202]
MKIPRTPAQLKTEIELSATYNGDLRIRQLIKILEKVDDELIIEGVFLTIEDKSNLYKTQKCAGWILTVLNPKTNKSLESLLIQILANWDKSCNDIPFWMKKLYGLEEIQQVINELENRVNSDPELEKLNTIKWWLKIK